MTDTTTTEATEATTTVHGADQVAAAAQTNAGRMPEGHAARDAEPAPSAELVDERRRSQLQVWQGDQELARTIRARDDAALDVEVPVTLREQLALARALSDAELLPRAYRGKPADVLLAMQLGTELGLRRLQALRLLNVVEGTPSLGAEGVRACILAAGHDVWTEEDLAEVNSYGIPTSCTVMGKRRGSERVYRATFTIEQAVRAGLCAVARDENDGQVTAVRARSQLGKVLPWEAYTEAMLEARATTVLGRRAFADVLGGLSYTAEELGPNDNAVPQPPAGRQGPRERPTATPSPAAGAIAALDAEDRAGEPLEGVVERPDATTVEGRVLASYCLHPISEGRPCTRDLHHDGKHAHSAGKADELRTMVQALEAAEGEPAGPAVVEGEVVAVPELVEDQAADAAVPEVPEQGPAPWPATAQPADSWASTVDPAVHPDDLALPAEVAAAEAEALTASAPTELNREALWQEIELLAQGEGKTPRQLMLRWSLANKANPEEATAEQLAAFLASRS